MKRVIWNIHQHVCVGIQPHQSKRHALGWVASGVKYVACHAKYTSLHCVYLLPKSQLPCGFETSTNLNYISPPMRIWWIWSLDEYYDLFMDTPVALAAAEGNKTVTLNASGRSFLWATNNISLMPHHLDNDLALNSFMLPYEEFSEPVSEAAVCDSRLPDVHSKLITRPILSTLVLHLSAEAKVFQVSFFILRLHKSRNCETSACVSIWSNYFSLLMSLKLSSLACYIWD